MATLDREDWSLMRTIIRDEVTNVVTEALVDYPTKDDLAKEVEPIHEDLRIINLRLEHMEGRWGKAEAKIADLAGNDQDNRTRISKLERKMAK